MGRNQATVLKSRRQSKEDLIRAYLKALPDALRACEVQEYTVKLNGPRVEVTVVKRFGSPRTFTLDLENNEKDWWALMREET